MVQYYAQQRKMKNNISQRSNLYGLCLFIQSFGMLLIASWLLQIVLGCYGSRQTVSVAADYFFGHCKSSQVVMGFCRFLWVIVDYLLGNWGLLLKILQRCESFWIVFYYFLSCCGLSCVVMVRCGLLQIFFDRSSLQNFLSLWIVVNFFWIVEGHCGSSCIFWCWL